MTLDYASLALKPFVIAGPNVIESAEHTLRMAHELSRIFSKYDVTYVFKTSFDKANRSSIKSYRGLGFEEGLRILRRVKQEVGIPIITDIHETWQAQPVSMVADIIQIPAFLCRQTDLLKAAAETEAIIHVKKGQFCTAEQMHACKEKIRSFGNNKIILCERGNSFGYGDLVVDPRNLVWLKSDTNLVSMDITHCLQRPSQQTADGVVRSGGYRELIPFMGKVARALDVHGLFLEVHDNPDAALCDAPTQWPMERLEWLLDHLDISHRTLRLSTELCILCGKQLLDYQVVYSGKIRNDSTGTAVIGKCGHCQLKQLISNDSIDLEYYKSDMQTKDKQKALGTTMASEHITGQIHAARRIAHIKPVPGSKILDVGAGYCTFARNVVTSVPDVHVTCIEPSIKRTQIGQSLTKEGFPQNLIVVNTQLDDTFAEMHADEYDLVTCWHVLEHLDREQLYATFRNMHRCCRPGGRIVIEVPNANDELQSIKQYRERVMYIRCHNSYWDENSLMRFTQMCGIKKNVCTIEYVQRYGFRNYLNWLYDLGEQRQDDINTDNSHTEWLAAKKQAKNTDSLMLTIIKQ